MTTAPASTAIGAYSALTAPPAQKNARSTPPKPSGSSSSTRTSPRSSWISSPAVRSEAKSRSSAIGNCRS